MLTDHRLTDTSSTELLAETDHAEQFWQFSLALYPLLQTELLALQDQYSCNANMLLLSAWRPLLPPLPQLMQALSPQHLTTQQVRQIRRDVSRALKDKASDPLLMQLRQQLLDTELTAERLEQRALVQCCADSSCCTVTAATLRQGWCRSSCQE